MNRFRAAQGPDSEQGGSLVDALSDELEQDVPGVSSIAPASNGSQTLPDSGTKEVAVPELPVRLAILAVLTVGSLTALREIDRLVSGALSRESESRSIGDVTGPSSFSATDAWTVWADRPELQAQIASWLTLYSFIDVVFVVGYVGLMLEWLKPTRASRLETKAAVRGLRRVAHRILAWLKVIAGAQPRDRGAVVLSKAPRPESRQSTVTRQQSRPAGSPATGSADSDGAKAGEHRLAKVGLAALVVFEALEFLLLLFAARQLDGGAVPGPLRGAVAVCALLKWLAVAVLVVALVCDSEQRASIGRAVRRAARALNYQRLSLVVVAVLALLSLVPLPNIWDQLPDVQRGWFDTGTLRGFRHMIAAALLSLLVGVLLFVLGRQRSERAWFDSHPDLQAGDKLPEPKADPNYGWWAVGLALALGLSLMLAGPLQRPDLVDWQVVAIFAGLPLLIVVVSWGLKVLEGKHSTWQVWARPRVVGTPEQRCQRAYDTWTAGDVLALSVIVVSTLSLVRSLTAPLLLGWADEQVRWGARIVVLVAAILVSLAVFPVAARVLRRVDGPVAPDGDSGLRQLLRPTAKGASGGPFSRAFPVLVWAASAVGLVALMLFPLWLGEKLGIVATILMALGCWAIALGFFIVHLQHREPLQVFALLRLRSNPVLSLLVLTPLLVSVLPQDADLHALRTPAVPAPLPDRPSLQVAFDRWLAGSAACNPAGGTTVRPMVLIAASGGGIRAAAWTTGVLDRLQQAGSCAASATFLSSGVSGGSVGLALSRGSDPVAAVARLAEPEALTAGITGTVVGDLVAGTTGVRLPSLVGGEWDWRDRAGLMELAWERKEPTLAAGYNASPVGPGGYLILNSTATGSGCKVLISQVRLDVEPAVKQDGTPVDEAAIPPVTPRCGALSGQPPASLDLQRTYGQCTPDMSWATASMLSARFPTVTPAGRVPPERRPNDEGGQTDCRDAQPLQLIDGGYAESSGVGTLADIAPALQQVVRRHNASMGGAGPFVVPMVLYLEDETRKDIASGPEDLSPELFVPLVGRGAKDVQTSTPTWLQRVSDAYADPCPATGDTACRAAVQQVRNAIEGGVVVATPLTRPSVDAPLGWTLSQDSRSQLKRGLDEQAAGCEVQAGRYTCLRTLLDLLGAPPPP